MASSSVEVAKLKCENSKLEYEKAQLYSELKESNIKTEMYNDTIRSLRQEISKLKLMSV